MWCIALEQDIDAQIKLLTKKDEKDNLTYQQGVVS
jgi:hypothetical protein